VRRRKTRSKINVFDKIQFIEKELIDKISLWMLRAIINFGGHHKKLIDNNNCFYVVQLKL
jgi:hypothetical protein